MNTIIDNERDITLKEYKDRPDPASRKEFRDIEEKQMISIAKSVTKSYACHPDTMHNGKRHIVGQLLAMMIDSTNAICKQNKLFAECTCIQFYPDVDACVFRFKDIISRKRDFKVRIDDQEIL